MTRTAPKLARARREIAAAAPNVLRVLPPSAETKESGGGPPWNGYRNEDRNLSGGSDVPCCMLSKIGI